MPDGSKFTTLDEIERSLTDKDLMICNAEDGMCIAGVFGGITSGVKDSTKNIFLESACFEAIGLRKTSQHHNLRTDAAMRFEKGVDPNGCVEAIKRAALLIKELAGGEIASEIVDIYPAKVTRPEVSVRYKQVNRLAGIEIPKETVNSILNNLEMETVNQDEDKLTVKVPTNKVDVLREIDLIEEILRIYGFNNIPMPEAVNSSLSYAQAGDKATKLRNVAADYLVGQGFNEMMNNSITQSAYYEEKLKEENTVAILNSLTSELDTLRKNMYFSGLESIAYNQNRKNSNLRLFELGTIYATAGEGYKEQESLAIFVTGNSSEDTWQGGVSKTSFFDLKRVVNNLLSRVGIDEYKSIELEGEEAYAYGLAYEHNKQALVKMGLLHPNLTEKMDVSGEVYCAIVNWNLVHKISSNKEHNFAPLPKYPAIKRDVALLIDKKVGFGEIEIIARKIGKKLLTNINLFDVYEDAEKLGADKKSYAVSFTFLDETKTLTKKEVDKLMSKLIYQFENTLGAQQK